MELVYGVFAATLGVSLRASISISGSPVIIINAGQQRRGGLCYNVVRKIYTNDNRRAAIFFFLFLRSETQIQILLHYYIECELNAPRAACSPEKRENYSVLGAEEFTAAAAAISFLNIFGRAHTLQGSRVGKLAVLSSGQHRFFDLLIEIVLRDTSLFFNFAPTCLL